MKQRGIRLRRLNKGMTLVQPDVRDDGSGRQAGQHDTALLRATDGTAAGPARRAGAPRLHHE